MAEGLMAEIFAACSGGAVLTGWAISRKTLRTSRTPEAVAEEAVGGIEPVVAIG